MSFFLKISKQKNFLIAIVLLITIQHSKAYASPQEDKPATKRAKELVSIINSGDHAKAEKYVRESFSPQFEPTYEPLEILFFARVHDEHGRLIIHQITEPKTTEAVITSESELIQEWRQITITIEPQEPYRIVSISSRIIPPPADKTEKPLKRTEAMAKAEFNTYIQRLEKAETFSGDVLVAKNGKIVFHQAYGEASKEFGVKNQTGTRFIIGSINKMFTTTGILQLVEQGKLSLEDKVIKYMPGVLKQEIASKIKIKNLLTHTSGLGDFLFTPDMATKSRDNFRTIKDYLPQLADDTLLFEPGSQWSYSNTGFLVLGAIIEKLSGLTYDEYIKKNVFHKAGMTGTGAPELDLVPHGLASAYDKEYVNGKPIFRSDRYSQVVRGTPAGGGFSTATDLFKFTQALTTYKLLKPETTKMMVSPKPELKSPGYGFGTQIFDANRIGHTGGGPGTYAVVEIDQQNNLTIIVLGNQSSSGSGAVVRRARKIYGS